MINPFQLMQMLKSGSPQQTILDSMRQQSGNNPVINNALNMAEKNDAQGLEKLARNLCKEKNINPDEMINNIRQKVGVR